MTVRCSILSGPVNTIGLLNEPSVRLTCLLTGDVKSYPNRSWVRNGINIVENMKTMWTSKYRISGKINKSLLTSGKIPIINVLLSVMNNLSNQYSIVEYSRVG